MQFRLLIITLLGFICTTFVNVADKIYVSDNETISYINVIPENHGYQISNENFDIINPAESHYTCQYTGSRNFTKRKTDQRLPDRYTFQTNGKSYDASLINDYQQSLYHDSNGLLIPLRSHISLRILRI